MMAGLRELQLDSPNVERNSPNKFAKIFMKIYLAAVLLKTNL